MDKTRFWHGFGFALFSLLALISIIVSIVTYTHTGNSNKFLHFLALNHLWIMTLTIFISISYGFVWAKVLQNRFRRQKNISHRILNIVISFLSETESDVLKHLVDNKGQSTQAKISKINEMGGVKALRTVQKMQEKRLVKIHKNGKSRMITLNDEKLKHLSDEE